tara:strand:- start:902 stop:1552 length:651 start_codon:yes stop_codon:yes gene_type:complete
MGDFAEQGSAEWFAERLGIPTGSKSGLLIGKGRSAEFTNTAITYQTQLVCERLTGLMAESIDNKYTQHGHANEPLARQLFDFHNDDGFVVEECGFIRHPEIDNFGSSPDGLIDGGCIEIKCPYTVANHILTIESGQVLNADYGWQIQSHMAVTGTDFCKYISFHPDVPTELQLCVIHVTRDDEMQDKLADRIPRFNEQIDERVQEIRSKVGELVDA